MQLVSNSHCEPNRKARPFAVMIINNRSETNDGQVAGIGILLSNEELVIAKSTFDRLGGETNRLLTIDLFNLALYNSTRATKFTWHTTMGPVVMGRLEPPEHDDFITIFEHRVPSTRRCSAFGWLDEKEVHPSARKFAKFSIKIGRCENGLCDAETDISSSGKVCVRRSDIGSPAVCGFGNEEDFGYLVVSAPNEPEQCSIRFKAWRIADYFPLI